MTEAIYLIDTNIFIYSVGKEHPLKPPCQTAIQKIREGKIKAIINTEIIQEILYRYQSIKETTSGIRLARDVESLAYKILPVTERDLSLAIDILASNPQIQVRDTFHAATMINNGVKKILSVDPHFDLISGIKRIDPAQI